MIESWNFNRTCLRYDVIIRHQKLKIEKFCDLSSDIDYNSKKDVFRYVIYLIINQCDPGRIQRTQSVRRPRSTSKRSVLVYLYTISLCNEMIEETARRRKLIFLYVGVFWLWLH